MSEPRARALRHSGSAFVAVGAIVVASTAARTFFAWKHATPRYFPDEYIYATLGRALAHGHYTIRGESVKFPAVLEPLLSAPIWRFFSTETAHRLIQAENSAAVSLAAVPVYLLARWLGIRRTQALLCALFAVAVPTLALVPLNIADLIAYPLALTATLVGMRALETPTLRLQGAFLAFAVLSTLARTQYIVLVPAYVVGAVILARRDVLRKHRIALFALAPVAVAGLVAVTTFYSGVLHTTRLNGSFIRWFFLQPFLLALETGVVMVPGAIAALVRPSSLRDRAFALYGVTASLLLLIEGSVYSSNGGRFKERYLFEILPLVPVAYFSWLRRGRPHRWVVVGTAIAIAVAAARLPISSYAISTLRTDSQFLYAVGWAEARYGYGRTAFWVALAATAASALAVLIAYKGDRAVAALVGILVALAATVGAVHVDVEATQSLRANLPRNLTWVDDATHGPVTALLTPGSSQGDLFIAAYWNPSIDRELRVAGALALDTFSTPRLRLAPDGRLLNARGDLLFDSSGSTGTFADAHRVAHAQSLELWHPLSTPRFRLLVEHRDSTGFLGPFGRIRAWPTAGDRSRVAVSFVLSLPSDWKRRVRFHIGKQVFRIHPGESRHIRCTTSAGPFDRVFFTPDGTVEPDFEVFSVRMTRLSVVDLGGRSPRTSGGCVAD